MTDHLAGIRVMIVEDNDDIRELLGIALEVAGASVVGAASAREAFSLLKTLQDAPDVLVSDVGMPGESGLQFIARVRALPLPLGGIKAVAVSGFTSTGDRNQAIAAGFDLHLKKPLPPSVLVSAVAGLIGRSITT